MRARGLQSPESVLLDDIQRAASTLRAYVVESVLSVHSVTWNEWLLLRYLGTEPREFHKVAAELDIAKSSLSDLTARLCRRSLVRRRESTDRRTFGLELTPLGASLLAEVAPAVAAIELEIVARLDLQTKTSLANGLRRIAGSTCSLTPD